MVELRLDSGIPQYVAYAFNYYKVPFHRCSEMEQILPHGLHVNNRASRRPSACRNGQLCMDVHWHFIMWIAFGEVRMVGEGGNQEVVLECAPPHFLKWSDVADVEILCDKHVCCIHHLTQWLEVEGSRGQVKLQLLWCYELVRMQNIQIKQDLGISLPGEYISQVSLSLAFVFMPVSVFYACQEATLVCLVPSLDSF